MIIVVSFRTTKFIIIVIIIIVITRLWCLRKVSVIPVVVGALGCVTKEAEQYIEKIGIKIRTEVMQATALLETATTLRKVLEN